MKTDNYTLKVSLPDGQTLSYPLPASGLRVGRSHDNDVVVQDPKVSSHHARIQLGGTGVEIIDVGSRNGTYINGQRIPAHSARRLTPGDIVRLGDTTAQILQIQQIHPQRDQLAEARAGSPPAGMSRAGLVLQTQIAGRTDEIPITKTDVTIGRGDDNTVILDDSRVSSRHARLIFAKGQLQVMDLGSLNGTRLNGEPLPSRQATSFRVGDRVQIAGYLFAVRVATPDAPAPSPLTEQVRLSSAGPAGLIVHAEGRQERHPLTESTVTIGRSSDNDIVVSSTTVSGHHARIQRSDGTFWIVDLDSRNGLIFEGRRISRKSLVDGDVFYVGRDAALEFRENIGFQPVVPRPSLPPAQTLRLTTDTIAIGRAHDNTMVIDHPQVSRYHAMVERLGMRQRVRDLKSSNGVFVNGQRVETEAWLKKGDEIRIGTYRLRVGENVLERMAEEGLRIDALRLQKWVTKKLNLLEDISLSIHPQEFVALVGLSGAGKSTLMDALNGFRPATHGAVFVNNVNLYQQFDMFRNDMGYVPQQDIVHTQLTVYQALAYSAQLRMPADTTAHERHQRVIEVLEELDLAERKDVPIRKLSGGQLKRVSIGVELLTKPRLFFLDEPTSGLDPGTEYNMMRLLRKLADQGRTILLITHATKNVMMCDKVIILVRGGYLAYYGPPEEALRYFDQFRTDRERRTKDIEFDDIYTVLEDEGRGTSEEWAERYKRSPQYAENVAERLQEREGPRPAPDAPTGVTAAGMRRRATSKGVSALRQFFILSKRNLSIMVRDMASLVLMLALAPLLSIISEMSGHGLFDPVDGSASGIITSMFMGGLIVYMVGALASVREIVKEINIYKRERIVNLKIWSYILSKVWVGFVLALYNAFFFVVVRQGVMLRMWPGTDLGHGAWGFINWFAMYVTQFLVSLSGYLMGLAISAIAPNQNVAILLVIVALVPQFLFAGGMMPLDVMGTGGEVISNGVTNRWAFEAAVNITGIGQPLVDDPCWDDREKDGEEGVVDGWNDYLSLSDEEKHAAGCVCMGSRIFTGPCSTFPGIKNEDWFADSELAALTQPEPEQPARPTPLPTYTPYPTLTPYPTMTPLPTPQDPRNFDAYTDEMEAQGNEYQDLREAQGDEYQDLREAQGEEYREIREAQGEGYEATVEEYSDQRSAWERNREQAIGGAEGLLKAIFDGYGHTFHGNYLSRWINLCIIAAGTLILAVVFQRRKDSV